MRGGRLRERNNMKKVNESAAQKEKNGTQTNGQKCIVYREEVWSSSMP